MKERQFEFIYSWTDLKPVRAFAVAVFVVQIVGAVVGLLLLDQDILLGLWLGGAAATFPGFVFGLAIQAREHPGSTSQNHVLVRRLGLIALLCPWLHC